MNNRKTLLISALALVSMGISSTAPAAPSCFSGTTTAGNTTVNLTVSGQSRTFRLHIPSGLPAGQAVPVVLALHGNGGTASALQSSSGWDATANTNRFVVAYPQGISGSWNAAGFSPNVDDVGFLKAIVDNVSTKVRVAPNSVYITGYSLGGAMSHHMACTQADYFAAAHPFIAHLWTAESASCSPSRPIAVQEFAGRSDNIVPYAGGPLTISGITLNFLSAQNSYKRWAAINGCTGTTTTVLSSGNNIIEQTGSCNGGVKVGLGSLVGGHEEFNGSGINPTANAWAFLSAHKNPNQPADACTGGGGEEPPPPPPPAGVNVWLEAERGIVGSAWTRVANTSSASNGAFVVRASGSSTFAPPPTSSGWITLPFSVGSGGAFNLWFRTTTPNGFSNSFWIRVDNGPWVQWENLPSSPSPWWSWNRFASPVALSPGNHILTIAYREAWAQLDKIHLTTTTTVPSGTGGAPNN